MGPPRARFPARGKATRKHSTFHTSRVIESDSGDELEERSRDSAQQASPLASVNDGSQSETSSESDDESIFKKPYASLLGALDSALVKIDTQSRKRKRGHGEGTGRQPAQHSPARPIHANGISQAGNVAHEGSSDEDSADYASAAEDVEALDTEANVSDPFDTHFANPDQPSLSSDISNARSNEWTSSKALFDSDGTWTQYLPKSPSGRKQPTLSSKETIMATMKQRLREPANTIIRGLGPNEDALHRYISDYRDVLYAARATTNASTLRSLVCLHALNHVFKTRDRISKNNERLTKLTDNQEREFRDQGFTRPKVLILLPTKNSCVKYVESIIELSRPQQQENKKKFQETYYREKDFTIDQPEDFRELFAGDDDDSFRLGLNFSRKNLKLFSQFYNSDIIIASPLGLRRTIEKGDPKTKIKPDSDFLSSIELVIIDQADALLMQVWDHIEYIFSHLNKQPKEAHGCDFSRVRNWYLDGNANYLRQTVILTPFATPELNNIFSKHMCNCFGKFRYSPGHRGAVVEIGSGGGMAIKQSFSRFQSPSPLGDPDARFEYFQKAIVPNLARLPQPPDGAHGILIFIPNYFDFVRVRNFFATSTAVANLSFGSISENDTPADADIRRARSHFNSGRHSVLLYSGRAHHFFRYRLKGVKRVVLYSIPDNPIFYREIVGGFLGRSVADGRVDVHEVSSRSLFSKWDILRLERIVGSSRVGSMLQEKGGDTFDFI